MSAQREHFFVPRRKGSSKACQVCGAAEDAPIHIQSGQSPKPTKR